MSLHLGAIARNFPQITLKSLLARLAYCQQSPFKETYHRSFPELWQRSLYLAALCHKILLLFRVR
ncbi:hypothetical protein VL20_2130 [Microcystis panniformis FACHB-1757]|uniref:Uncharacterized protein n=1 Tax=Microcystis panniformis FACHB-1757 TaxID=1638788 RepID=A0A0K1RZD1_9CHRO|nr:hypothetical protein VL20_2130 [Microcystis panniformis FACHB-1757]